MTRAPWPIDTALALQSANPSLSDRSTVSMRARCGASAPGGTSRPEGVWQPDEGRPHDGSEMVRRRATAAA